jgi:uncharacterized protein YbbK (DUF523 family)
MMGKCEYKAHSYLYIDLTQQIQDYAQRFLANETISGFILKNKSPSCGVENCQVKDQQGLVKMNSTGVFCG